MAINFWSKKPPEGETEEQRKVREEKEEQEFLSKIGLAVEAKMKPLSEKVDSWDKRWETLERAATETGDGGGGEDPDATEEEKREKARRIENGKLLAATILTNARVTEKEVLDEIKDKFPEFIPQVKEIFANTAVERKGMADYAVYCRNVISMIIGKAAMNGGLRYNEGTKTFFLEDQGGAGEADQHDFLAPDMTWSDPRSGKTLTGRQQLAKLGISAEDFAKSVKSGVV